MEVREELPLAGKPGKGRYLGVKHRDLNRQPNSGSLIRSEKHR